MIDLFTRAHDGQTDPPPLHLLPTQQRRIVEVVDAFERATGEACSISLVARRLHIHHSTVQDHLSALHRKGWLKSATAPVSLRRPLDS